MGCSPAKSVPESRSVVIKGPDGQKFAIVSKVDKLTAWHTLAADLEFTDDEDDETLMREHPEKVELAGNLTNPATGADGAPYIMPVSKSSPPCDNCKEIFKQISIIKNTSLMMTVPGTIYFFDAGDCVSMKQSDSS